MRLVVTDVRWVDKLYMVSLLDFRSNYAKGLLYLESKDRLHLSGKLLHRHRTDHVDAFYEKFSSRQAITGIRNVALARADIFAEALVATVDHEELRSTAKDTLRKKLKFPTTDSTRHPLVHQPCSLIRHQQRVSLA
ncbi:hypothetical protein VTN02DRAFT_5077 [Thermoascus thermophilus]